MRKKMYKVGKFWVAATIGFLVVSESQTVTAQADSKEAVNFQSSGSAPEIKPQNDELIGGVDGNYFMLPNGDQQFILKKDKLPVKGLHKIDGNLQFFDLESGVQQKGTWQTINGDKYYFAEGSGNAVIGTVVIDGKVYGFDHSYHIVKNDFVINDDLSTYYFDKNGNTVTGLQTINGKQYFFKESGEMLKGGTTAKTIDGTDYYFDAEDGHATIANKKTFNEGLTNQDSDFTDHNQIADTNNKSIDNFEGFITPDSWYRPKDVLKNGETWEKSSEVDRRPLLMVWWPDQETETNYVRFMSEHGLLEEAQLNAQSLNQNRLNELTRLIQTNIEKKIASDNSVEWLRALMVEFRGKQPNWNAESEKANRKDGLQGGTLAFQNSNKTPNANSLYRLLNRSPLNQDGKQGDEVGGFEFLLANDVDNSNPAVQAEQLNWMYFLLNFGSKTAQDGNANFDGIRVDAVDNVDADLLQIAAEYFKAAYKTHQNEQNANSHISILEDWSFDDAKYVFDKGADQLTMDFKQQVQSVFSLSAKPNVRASLSRFLEWFNVNRSVNDTENNAIPNYSFVRAHDSHVQEIIAQIIQELHPEADGLRPNMQQIEEAFEIYNVDQSSTNKKYTMYNIPAAYAMLLTNKDTVPRVYYGDLYMDDGQYMSQKSPYYDAIVALLRDRVKFVAGGQTLNTGTDNNGQKTHNSDIMTSVRFGKGLMNVTDTDGHVHTDGAGVIISNNPDLQLENGEKVVLHMGAAHRNQKFRASLLSTKDGLKVFTSDDGAPVLMTDDNGDLIFDSSWIYGCSDSQVSGYLAVWVPIGAAEKQDARTASSADKTFDDGKTFHSNAALDSQLIYEGFSNFQAMPTNESEFANVKIKENVEFFKELGVTSFQFAPQYRSTSEGSFLDSIIQNGYSFNDRYDLGFAKKDGTKNPTKYGTDEQLRDAIRAVHQNGMQAIADFVPDQLYDLPNKELVEVNRTDSFGHQKKDSEIKNLLYILNTKGSGEDYQAKFGGAYLDELQQKYPELFKMIQISTGKAIDPSEKIKEWSAKYLNGTNIAGQGAHHVLKDWAQNQYFTIGADGTFLPKALTGEGSNTGFVRENDDIAYYSLSRYRAQNSFIEVNGYWFYFDASGHMVTGEQTIDGSLYLFLPNGVELRNHAWVDQNNQLRYSGVLGDSRVLSNVLSGNNGEGTFFSGKDGGQYFKLKATNELAKGMYIIDGNVQFFDFANGAQAKGIWKSYNGDVYYFQEGSGNAVSGLETIDGITYSFSTDGKLLGRVADAKNPVVQPTADGSEKIPFMPESSHYQGYDNAKFKYEAGKSANTGLFQDKKGNLRYFDSITGFQAKGQIINVNGHSYCFDQDSGLGEMIKDVSGGHFVKRDQAGSNGRTEELTFYFDLKGELVKGLVIVDGQIRYFDSETGVQYKGKTAKIAGATYYFGRENGSLMDESKDLIQPVEPVNLDKPVKPDKPGDDGHHDTPDQPGIPDKPSDGGHDDEHHNTPDQPVNPDKPGDDGHHNTPDQPVQPVTPEQPGTPGQQVQPQNTSNNVVVENQQRTPIVQSPSVNENSSVMPEQVGAQNDNKDSNLAEKATAEPKLSRVERNHKGKSSDDEGFFQKAERSIGGTISDAGKSIGHALSNAGEAVGHAFADAGHAIGEAAHAVANAVSDVTDAVVETTQHVWHSVTNFFKDWFM